MPNDELPPVTDAKDPSDVLAKKAKKAKEMTDKMAPAIPGGASVKSHRERMARRLREIDKY